MSVESMALQHTNSASGGTGASSHQLSPKLVAFVLLLLVLLGGDLVGFLTR